MRAWESGDGEGVGERGAEARNVDHTFSKIHLVHLEVYIHIVVKPLAPHYYSTHLKADKLQYNITPLT